MNLSLVEPARWAADELNDANELLMAAARESRALVARRDAVRGLLAATRARTEQLRDSVPPSPEQLEAARRALDDTGDFDAWARAHVAAQLQATPWPPVTPPPMTLSPEHLARLKRQEAEQARPVFAKAARASEPLLFGWIVLAAVWVVVVFVPVKAALLLAAIGALVAVVTGAIAFAKSSRSGAWVLGIAGVTVAPLLAVSGQAIRMALIGWLS
jgi:hypothetical protein